MDPRPSKRPRVRRRRDDRSALIRDIRGSYRAAVARTPLDEAPALVSAAVEGGFCFGPLDPVSNIIATAVARMAPPALEGTSSGAVTAVEERISSWAKEMARRSLDALVAFLVCYFPHLPTSVALRYLRAAKADLLAAVQLVEADRCVCAFRIDSRTARTALRCAALAAGHPSPDELVATTLSLASMAADVSKLLLPQTKRLSVADIEQLRVVLARGGSLGCKNPQELRAFVDASRLPAGSMKKMAIKDEPLATHTESLQRVLLERIHGFYLQALALLPRHDLRHRYHRSLVKVGHLYGPLDPVSNIIVNTVWYDAMFPGLKEHKFELAMVGRSALMRAERCSLAGLVGGLRAFAGDNLSEHDALCYLLQSNADLWAAMEALQACLKNQEGDRDPTFHCTVPSKLYRIMADAACHPNPGALQEFYASDRVSAPLPAKSMLLSLKDVESTIRALSRMTPRPCTPLKPHQLPPQNERFKSIISVNKDRFLADYKSLHRKLKVALDEYMRNTEGPELVIHVICGANEYVADSCGPEYSSINWPRSHLKYHYSHFNFLASSARGEPKLFFAECVNYEEESDKMRKTMCCPVVVPATDSEKVRCLYCEYSGYSIVHPVGMNYHGGDIDFEKMVLGKHTCTNECIFNRGMLVTDSMAFTEEDFVYFDPKRDHDLVKAVNTCIGVKEASTEMAP
ncbi:hypothetical protein ACP70R_046599 [Stipagrostis hirtigluma subsp. patula]